MLHNTPEYLDVWFALSFMGAITVPLNVHLKGDSLQYIVSHSDCKLIIVDKNFSSNNLLFVSYTKRHSNCCLWKNESVIISRHGKEQLVIELKDVLHTNNQHLPTEFVSSSSINSILYTSGTTGLPKGVMLSHSAYVNSAQSFANFMVGASSKDVLFTALPLFHINAGAHTVLGAISSNATIALGKRFSASRFWDEIRSHGATILILWDL